MLRPQRRPQARGITSAFVALANAEAVEYVESLRVVTGIRVGRGEFVVSDGHGPDVLSTYPECRTSQRLVAK